MDIIIIISLKNHACTVFKIGFYFMYTHGCNQVRMHTKLKSVCDVSYGTSRSSDVTR